MSIFGLNERKMQEYNLLVTEMFPIAEKKQILLPAASCPAVRQEETVGNKLYSPMFYLCYGIFESANIWYIK